MDTNGILHPIPARNTLFSSVNRTFTKIDHMLSYKASLKELQRIRIRQSVFSDSSGIKLEIKTKKSLKNPQMFVY